MRLIRLIITPLLAGTAACSFHKVPDDASNPLIGTWRLVQVVDWDSAGNQVQSMGAQSCGYLIYTATGQMSVHLASCEGPPAGRPYGGYFGTFTVDAARGRVVHHVEGGNSPEYTGTDQERQFRIRDDSLILGDDRTYRRVFLRVRQAARP